MTSKGAMRATSAPPCGRIERPSAGREPIGFESANNRIDQPEVGDGLAGVDPHLPQPIGLLGRR